jgi:hypothetical protein
MSDQRQRAEIAQEARSLARDRKKNAAGVPAPVEEQREEETVSVQMTAEPGPEDVWLVPAGLGSEVSEESGEEQSSFAADVGESAAAQDTGPVIEASLSPAVAAAAEPAVVSFTDARRSFQLLATWFEDTENREARLAAERDEARAELDRLAARWSMIESAAMPFLDALTSGSGREGS